MPLFFNQDMYNDGRHLGEFLKSREMNMMSLHPWFPEGTATSFGIKR